MSGAPGRAVPAASTRPRVLIVDDEPAVRDILSRILNASGFDAKAVADGRHALVVARRERFDLFLVDLVMPGMDGVRLCQELRELPEAAGRPVVILSGRARAEDVVAGKRAGARDVMVKTSLTIRELVARLLTDLVPEEGAPAAEPPAGAPAAAGDGPAPPPSLAVFGDPALLDSFRPLLDGHALARRLELVQEARALPFVAAEVLRATADPDSTHDRIVRALEKDQALASRVIRVANSALYGRGQQIKTLQQAVVRIGMSGVRDLAVGASILEGSNLRRSSGGLDRLRFWEHSIAVAAIARALAARVSKNPDEAFLAGLLHDYGKALFADHFPREYPDVLRAVAATRRPLVEVEKRLLGIDHAELARSVMMRWAIPEEIARAVFHHHLPWQALSAAEVASGLGAIVRIGNALAKALAIGSGGDDALWDVPKEVFDAIGFRRQIGLEVLATVEEVVDELRAILLGGDGHASVDAGGVQAAVPPIPKPDAAAADVEPALVLEERRIALSPIEVLLRRAGLHVRFIDSLLEGLQGATPSTKLVIRGASPTFVRDAIEEADRAKKHGRLPARACLLAPGKLLEAESPRLSDLGLAAAAEPPSVGWLRAMLGEQ